MSNRTDFTALAGELADLIANAMKFQQWRGPVIERIETELHNAHVAAQEGSPCECRWCALVECQRCEGRKTVPYPTGLGEASRVPCGDCGGLGRVTEKEAEAISDQIRYEAFID